MANNGWSSVASPVMTGRTVIYSAEKEVTRDNILDIFMSAQQIHQNNATQIEYLYNYYKGKQPILNRTKTVREEINNKIIMNRANEIVSFKVGYLMGEPVQYIHQGVDETTEELDLLNAYMAAENKPSKDKELADWFHICGTSYRMILPDERDSIDESPFEIYTLDPRTTFVVYNGGIGHRPLLGCVAVELPDDTVLYSGYTADHYFEIVEDELTKWEPHTLRGIPIIEYPANEARMGAFELVLPILDEINNLESNAVDGVEQLIQAILVFQGVDLTDEQFTSLKEQGAIKVSENGKVYYVSQVLEQANTKVLVDEAYQAVLDICGMPNRNGGYSTSDTGKAVILRDGWSSAEARAKSSEMTFKVSEKEFLRLALAIMNTGNAAIRSRDDERSENRELKLASIEIRFTRRNYENILEKAQVLQMMLTTPGIHPKLAFEHCGMFVDPDIAYKMSEEYAAKEEAVKAKELEQITEEEADAEKAALDVQLRGQGNQISE